jgi:hypothetical protein
MPGDIDLALIESFQNVYWGFERTAHIRERDFELTD